MGQFFRKSWKSCSNILVKFSSFTASSKQKVEIGELAKMNFCKIELIRPYRFSLQLENGEENTLYIQADSTAANWNDQVREIRFDYFSKEYGNETVKKFDLLSGQYL